MPQHEIIVCQENDSTPQPDAFRCCPLGVQFYSKKDLPTYQVMELKLAPPGAKTDPLDVNGVVVHSQLDPKYNLYRIWIIFVDLPDEIKKRLTCLSQDAHTLCSHCQNF